MIWHVNWSHLSVFLYFCLQFFQRFRYPKLDKKVGHDDGFFGVSGALVNWSFNCRHVDHRVDAF